MPITINCDMGESFSLYKMGNDEAVMPFITHANIACGFHGSDPVNMHTAVKLAKDNNVNVGAHFSLPDLTGFGRREMKIERNEMADIILYQVGALSAYLKMEGMQLSHFKPHGALYGMAAKYEHIAHAVCDAAEVFQVPIFGMSNTLHEEIITARGLTFIPEFFADLEYGDDGSLLITRKHEAQDLDALSKKTLKAVKEGIVISVGKKEIPVRAETICIHSDTPDVVAIAKTVRKSIGK